jgi:hypothetical protein
MAPELRQLRGDVAFEIKAAVGVAAEEAWPKRRPHRCPPQSTRSTAYWVGKGPVLAQPPPPPPPQRQSQQQRQRQRQRRRPCPRLGDFQPFLRLTSRHRRRPAAPPPHLTYSVGPPAAPPPPSLAAALKSAPSPSAQRGRRGTRCAVRCAVGRAVCRAAELIAPRKTLAYTASRRAPPPPCPREQRRRRADGSGGGGGDEVGPRTNRAKTEPTRQIEGTRARARQRPRQRRLSRLHLLSRRQRRQRRRGRVPERFPGLALRTTASLHAQRLTSTAALAADEVGALAAPHRAGVNAAPAACVLRNVHALQRQQGGE